jgi:hypothetical protein
VGIRKGSLDRLGSVEELLPLVSARSTGLVEGIRTQTSTVGVKGVTIFGYGREGSYQFGIHS